MRASAATAPSAAFVCGLACMLVADADGAAAPAPPGWAVGGLDVRGGARVRGGKGPCKPEALGPSPPRGAAWCSERQLHGSVRASGHHRWQQGSSTRAGVAPVVGAPRTREVSCVHAHVSPHRCLRCWLLLLTARSPPDHHHRHCLASQLCYGGDGARRPAPPPWPRGPATCCAASSFSSYA